MVARKLIKTEDGYTLEGVSPQIALIRNDYPGWSVAYRGALAVARPGAYSMFRLRRSAEAFANFVADTLSNERLESFDNDNFPTANERQAIVDHLHSLLKAEER